MVGRRSRVTFVIAKEFSVEWLWQCLALKCDFSMVINFPQNGSLLPRDSQFDAAAERSDVVCNLIRRQCETYRLQ